MRNILNADNVQHSLLDMSNMVIAAGVSVSVEPQTIGKKAKPK